MHTPQLQILKINAYLQQFYQTKLLSSHNDKTISWDPSKTLIEYFNPIRPALINIVADKEFAYFKQLTYQQSLNLIDQNNLNINQLWILVGNDLENTNNKFVQLLLENNFSIIIINAKNTSSNLAVIDRLRDFLQVYLSPQQVVHGVYLDVFSAGVLITGDSGTGKSNLALELINRGHKLICDDAPIFYRPQKGIIIGRCPSKLKNLLEIRELGIINISQLFGEQASCDYKRLDLIVEISSTATAERVLTPKWHCFKLLAEDILTTRLSLALSANRAILIETAVNLGKPLLQKPAHFFSSNLRSLRDKHATNYC